MYPSASKSYLSLKIENRYFLHIEDQLYLRFEFGIVYFKHGMNKFFLVNETVTVLINDLEESFIQNTGQVSILKLIMIRDYENKK